MPCLLMETTDAMELASTLAELALHGDLGLEEDGEDGQALVISSHRERGRNTMNRSLRLMVLVVFSVMAASSQRTQPVTDPPNLSVSVLGAVNRPGVHELQGDKTLFEVLLLA